MEAVLVETLHHCIYCKRQLARASFSREHVLSRAFGTFKDAPVLHDAVCRECNQYFGDHLETRVARGAFEGMLRYRSGATPSTEKPLRLRYVQLTLPDESAWAGMRLELVWRDGRLLVNPLNQVGFLDSTTKKWVYLTREEITEGALQQHATLDTRSFRLFAHPDDQPTMLDLLQRHGVALGRLEDLPPPSGFDGMSEVSVEVTFTINKGIRRCMAKYAFNFLAFTCGPRFVLDQDFDPIRHFIRHGSETEYPLVVEALEPILRDDTKHRRQTSGHLLTINWAASRDDLVGQVSLFNAVTYHVSLARNFRGLWRPIKNGLHFNIRTKTIQPLTSFSGVLLPQISDL